jgi:hypothetical protein
MGLSVNLPELSRNIELFFKEKICEPNSRDGESGGASVHGGLAAVASREAHRSAARRRCRARELAACWEKKRGAPGGPHQGLRWPVRQRGEAGGSEGRTVVVKLSVGQVGARRSGTKGSTRCGDERRCERTLL